MYTEDVSPTKNYCGQIIPQLNLFALPKSCVLFSVACHVSDDCMGIWSMHIIMYSSYHRRGLAYRR